MKLTIPHSFRLAWRVFWANSFIESLANSWTSGALFLTISAGFLTGLVGFTGYFTSLAFVPTLLTAFSPYIIAFTVSVGIYSYFHSLFSSYEKMTEDNAVLISNALEKILDEHAQQSSKLDNQSDFSTLKNKVRKYLIKDYQVATSNLLGRSLDRINRLIIIQKTAHLLSYKTLPNNQSPYPILIGCILTQRDNAIKHHREHSFWGKHGITESEFTIACDNILNNEKYSQNDCKKNYLDFFYQYQSYYQTILSWDQKQAEIQSLEAPIHRFVPY